MSALARGSRLGECFMTRVWEDWHMADFWRFFSAIGCSAIVYITAKADMAMGGAAVAFFVLISAGWSESRFERIMNAINELQRR